MQERSIPGFSRYRATEDGKIVSSWRGGTVLKPYKNNKGYFCVSLYTDDKQTKVFTVHRLVALAWHDKPEGKNTVCHRDGIKENVHKDNLYWGTLKENVADAIRHGTYKCENNGKAKLTMEQVQALRIISDMVPRGKREMFANMFNVHPSTIKRAISGESWK